MKTGGVHFTRGIYEFTSSNPDNTTLNYNLKNRNKVLKQHLFTDILRLEKDNGFHDRSRKFDYWLYLRDDTNWKRCKKTGLAVTAFNNILEGNISRELELTQKTKKGKNLETPQHLVIAQFRDLNQYVILDIFNNFYISNPGVLNAFIMDHIKINKGANN